MNTLSEVDAIELLLVVENKRLRAENARLRDELNEARWALTNLHRRGW